VLHFPGARYHQTSQSLLISIAERATILTPGIRLSGEHACYQRDRDSYLLHRNRDEDQPLPNPEDPLRRLAGAEPASVIPVPLASSVTCVVTQW
jgi:hypothetical protein